MQLSDADVSVTLSVAGYEFPTGDTQPDFDWYDANWLQVEGAIQIGGRCWFFRAPCLLTSEARSMADWLEEASRDRAKSLHDGDLDHAWDDGALTFLEPALGLSVQETDDAYVIVRVHLAHEAADPELPEDEGLAKPPPYVRVRTTRESLARAADDWRRELRAWPVRSAARD